MTHYQTIKQSITADMIRAAATSLSEERSNVSTAVNNLVPVMLVRFVDKGDTQTVNDVVREAGHADVFEKRDALFAGRGSEESLAAGDRFSREMLGNGQTAVIDAVTAESGMRKSSVERLSVWVAAAVAGYIGNRIVRHSASMSTIVSELRAERGAIVNSLDERVARAAGVAGAAAGAKTCGTGAAVGTKKNNMWMIWLLVAVAALIIILLSVRSCNRRGDVAVVTESVTTYRTDGNASAARSGMNAANGSMTMTVNDDGTNTASGSNGLAAAGAANMRSIDSSSDAMTGNAGASARTTRTAGNTATAGSTAAVGSTSRMTGSTSATRSAAVGSSRPQQDLLMTSGRGTSTGTRAAGTAGATALVFVTHRLPGGEVIRVAEGSCEDCMLDYLKSDAYKDASDSELRRMWIQFDNVDFAHDSTDRLDEKSLEQLHNIAEILKNYPDVKVRIAGLADSTGSRVVNREISEKRADYVKSVLVKDGVKADRISTRGFGEELATVPADATDAQRAIDRSIAIRFMK